MSSLRTGSLAAKAGVNIETIRYYERRGLILQPERTASGYRIFDEEDLKRLRFIKEAQALGFSLKDIRELLDLRLAPRRSCKEVCERAATTLANVRQKIATLRAMEKVLARFARGCTGRRQIRDCRILQALDDRGTRTLSRTRTTS